MYTILYHVCMYTMYVVVLCVYVYTTQRACASFPPPCLLSVCVSVPVLVYCAYVASIVVVMRPPCRSYVVCGVVYVSTVSLGCVYYSRYVLLLMIVSAKA
jgi:hypothetical protein